MPERYAAASGVAWSVERRGVLVFGADGRGGRMLSYPQAAVWDLVVRGNTMDKVSEQLSAIAAVSEEAAKQIARVAVAQWREQGLLVEGGARG